MNIAALGAPASLIGVTGQDEAADSLANSLQAAGVRSVFQRIAHQPTIVKLRVMSRHQQLLRIDFEEPFATDRCRWVPKSTACSKASRCWSCRTTARAH